MILIAISGVALAALLVYTVMTFRECRAIARWVRESQARTDEMMAATARKMADTEQMMADTARITADTRQKMRELGLRPR